MKSRVEKKLINRVRRVFDVYHSGGNVNLEDILTELSKHKKSIKRLWFKCNTKYPDNRHPLNTYGLGNIENDMAYISDRWYAPFRLNWLLYVLDNYKEVKINLGRGS